MDNKIKIADDVIDFIKEKNLESSFDWLVNNVSEFFTKAKCFEISLSYEDDLIHLVVVSNYDIKDLSNIRFEFCETLLDFGHGELYRLLSIYQRRNVERSLE